MAEYSLAHFAYYTDQSGHSSVENFVHGFAMDATYFYLAVIEADVNSGTGPAVMIMKLLRTTGAITACTRLAVSSPKVQIQGICLDDTYVYVFVDQQDAIPTTGHVMKFYKLNGSTHLEFVCAKSISGSTYQQNGNILTGPDSNAALYHVGCTSFVGGNVALYKHNTSNLSLETNAVGRWITRGIRIAGMPYQDAGDSQYLYLLGRGIRTINSVEQHVPVLMRLQQSWSTDHTVMARQSAVYLAPKSANTQWETEDSDTFIDLNCSAVSLYYESTSYLWAVGSIPRAGQIGTEGQGADCLLMKINRNISGNMSIAAAYRITIPQTTEYGVRGWGITGDANSLYISSSFIQHSGLGDDTEVTANHKQYVCKINKTTLASTPASAATWMLGFTDPNKSCRNGSAGLILDSDGYLYVGGNSNNRSRQRREACIFKVNTDPNFTDINGNTSCNSLYDSTGLFAQFNEASSFTISQIYGGASDYCDAYAENSTNGWGSFNLYTETFTLNDSNSTYTGWSAFSGFTALTTGLINSSAIFKMLYPTATTSTNSTGHRRRATSAPTTDISSPDWYACLNVADDTSKQYWVAGWEQNVWRDFIMEMTQIAAAEDGRIDKVGLYVTSGALSNASYGYKLRFILRKPGASDISLLPGTSDSNYIGSLTNAYTSPATRGGSVDGIEWTTDPFTGARWAWSAFTSATGASRLRAGMRAMNTQNGLAWATWGINTMWLQVHWTPLIHKAIEGSGGMSYGGDGSVQRSYSSPVSEGLDVVADQAITWNGGITLVDGMSFVEFLARQTDLVAQISESMRAAGVSSNNNIIGVQAVDGMTGAESIIPQNIVSLLLSQAINKASAALAQGHLGAQANETMHVSDVLGRSVVVHATVIETAASSIAASGALVVNQATTEDMHATDTAGRSLSIPSTATESIQTAEITTRQTDVAGTAAQAMSISDILQALGTFGITAAQGLGLATYSSSGNIWNEPLTASITLAESLATMGILAALASETPIIGSTSTDSTIMGGTASDGIRTSDAAARSLAILREALAGTVIGDTPIRSLIVALTLAEILGLTDTAAVGEPKFEELTDGLAVHETVAQALDRFGVVLDGVSISDGASFLVEVNVSATDSLSFSETVARVTELVATVQESLGLADNAITFNFEKGRLVIALSSSRISLRFIIAKDTIRIDKK